MKHGYPLLSIHAAARLHAAAERLRKYFIRFAPTSTLVAPWVMSFP